MKKYNTCDTKCMVEPSSNVDVVFEEKCKCCGGAGIQTSNLDGLRHICPCCGGTGKKNNFKTFITYNSHKIIGKDE